MVRLCYDLVLRGGTKDVVILLMVSFSASMCCASSPSSLRTDSSGGPRFCTGGGGGGPPAVAGRENTSMPNARCGAGSVLDECRPGTRIVCWYSSTPLTIGSIFRAFLLLLEKKRGRGRSGMLAMGFLRSAASYGGRGGTRLGESVSADGRATWGVEWLRSRMREGRDDDDAMDGRVETAGECGSANKSVADPP